MARITWGASPLGAMVSGTRIDLKKFFDRVDHDILMSRLARHVKDKRFLRITRAFLNAGLMREGACILLRRIMKGSSMCIVCRSPHGSVE